VDLLTEMSALSLTDVTFTFAQIDYSATDGTYTYSLVFDYAPSTSHRMVLDMVHTPGTASDEYTGLVSYQVDDSFTGGNCPSSDVTHNGSISYESVSSTELKFQVRNGMFCGNGVDGRGTDAQVDATDKYTTSNVNGWGNNFSIFTANFDPSDMDGDYAYSWQAGPMDNNARTFNINISNSGVDGLSFYGYGDDIEDTDGSIDGFICNWAGPGSDHTIIEKAQYQEVSLNTGTGLVEAIDSDLNYAPTVSCDYDGTGTFVYDTDNDDDLTDEDSTLAVSNDLMDGDDLDGDSNATVEEVITDLGFTLPSM